MLQRGVWTKGCESNGCIEMSRGGNGLGVVEVEFTEDVVGFRDGTGSGVQLSFTREEWDNFRAAAKLGEFDLQ